MAKLGEVCDILNGYAFKSNQYTTSGVRIIRISNVQKGYIEDKSPVYYPCDDENVKKYELKQNDLLISLTGNVGRTALLEEKFLPAALNQRVSCVRLKEPDKVLKTYLFHLLNSDYFEQQCMKAAKGVAQKNLSPKWLFEYKIPIYSIERQKEISNTLDKIDLLIILRKQQLAKLDELVKARFVEMFGNPSNNSLGFPYEPLSNCLLSIENGKSFVCSNDMRQEENPAILKLSAVTYGVYQQDENKAILDSSMFVKSAEVHKGDLLFTRKNTPELVGMCAYVNDTAPNLMMPDLIFRLNTNEKINKIFLWKLINHEFFRGKIQNIATGSAKSMSNISKERLEKLAIILPPLHLQNDFAALVERVDQQKQTIQQSLEKLELLKKALMQEYFG